MLYYHELTYIHLPALVKVLYYRELTYHYYLILGIYLYRYSRPINSFVITTSIEGDNGILYHYKLSYIHLSNLGGVLYYHELTYPILPFTSILRTDILIYICQQRNHDKEIAIFYYDDSYRRGG
jgi:hypothetical protein